MRGFEHRGLSGTFDHLNTTDMLVLPSRTVDFQQLAKIINAKTYGMQRILSALVAERLAGAPTDELALTIKKLLDEGHF